jgi:hypothetical protein
MGMNANQEDMFSKLEEMRSVITEVNNQFKDPVSISVRFMTVETIAHRNAYRRTLPHSSACASQSSCPCMKPRE